MNSQLVLRTLAYTAVALAVLSAAVMLVLVAQSWSPLPFWDQWERVGAAQQLGGLFRPHNEHVIAIPRLFFALDASLFGGRNLFLLVVIQLVQAAHLALLIVLARRAGLGELPLVAVGAAAAAFLFSGAQIENFYWGFQVQFVLVYLLTTLCFTVALLGADRLRLDLAAVAAGIAATLCLSAGVLALPAAAAGSLFVRVSFRRRLMLAAGAALALAIYTGLGSSGAGSDAEAALRQPVAILYYALAYLGGPFGGALAELGGPDLRLAGRDAAQLGVLIGAGGLAAALFAAWFVLRRRPARPARVALLLVAGVVVAAAVLTALGRFQLGAPQALSSRYATPVLLFWTALLALYWSFARAVPRAVWRDRARIVLALCTVAAIALLLAGRPGWVRLAEGQAYRTDTALGAVVAGVDHTEALVLVHPSAQTVLRQAAVLRELGISVFAGRRERLIGEPVSELGPVTGPQACAGVIDAAPRFGDPGPHAGWRLTGWAWDLAAGRAPEYVVFAADGEVRGVAPIGQDRPDVVNAVDAVTDARVGFSGYARGRDTVIAYVVVERLEGAALCEIARR